jgi:uncharacterized protein DUF1844
VGKEQSGPRGFQMEEGEAPPQRRKADALPEMSFAGLVLSLSAGVMVHLGERPEGSAEAPEPNLELARQTIDILELLERKTRGNLDADEQQLLGSVLHELRMKYVARSRA